MCGIIGVYGPQAISPKDREEVAAGADAMARRGPDGEGFEAGPGWYFGHRRLAVLDLSTGRQPWVDPESGITLVYNGEIYNFRELRARLVELGHRFCSDCDTELVLRAYVEWGRGCVSRLEGMFAFALQDPRSDSIWMVRDRLGIKPLYYHFVGDRLRFGSSMKALFAFGSVDRRMDRAVLWHYLRTIRTTLGGRTLIEQVRSLEPGQELWWSRLGGGAPELRRYWELPYLCPEAKSTCTLAEAAVETRERVEGSVEQQLVSDVALGGFLSGGLDSSILTGLASGAEPEHFGTSSVGYEGTGFNEWAGIREAAAYHGVNNEEIHLDGQGYAADWAHLIAENGLPLSTPNEVPIWHLARGFGRRFKVALSGEGADEVFGGYAGPTFCAYDWDRAQSGQVDPKALARWYGSAELGGRRAHYFRVNSWLSVERLRSIMRPEFIPEAGADPVDQYYEGLFAAAADCTTFDAYMRVHLRVNLEGLLTRLDSSTMAASVEGRVPFTDHKLVEWLFSLPDRYKMSLRDEGEWSRYAGMNSFELQAQGQVETKRLLRLAFSGRVPEAVLERRKMSFPVPFAEWFRGPLKPMYEAVVHDGAGPGALLLDATAGGLGGVAGEVDPMLAWPLLNIALWQNRFGVVL